MNISSHSWELAWAAGFFDGEGCSYVITIPSGRKYHKLTLSQNERIPLERFVAAVGEGNITGPYKGRPKTHHWNVTGTGAVRAMARIHPFLSAPKRDQWARVSKEVSG